MSRLKNGNYKVFRLKKYAIRDVVFSYTLNCLIPEIFSQTKREYELPTDDTLKLNIFFMKEVQVHVIIFSYKKIYS